MTTLRRGAKGEAVELLQEHLGLAVDGRFGPATELAVRSFQARAHLVVDGVVGPRTWVALLAPGSHVASRFLSERDVVEVAEALGLEPACIKAVCEVEAPHGGFLPSGRPRILFEGHVFWRLLVEEGIDPEQYVPGRETILYPRWTPATRRFYLGGEREYERLEAAMEIDPACAQKGASWGRFQVLGSNFEEAGHRSLESFLDAMRRDERAHLDAFAAFITTKGLLAALREKKWAAFARGFNGAGYAANAYDTKLAQAYRRHALAA